MKKHLPTALRACASLLLLCSAANTRLHGADAPAKEKSSPAPAASPETDALLKQLQPALDELAKNGKAAGAYAIIDGKLLRLQPMSGYLSSPADLKASFNLAEKPQFIVIDREMEKPGAKPVVIDAFDWRFLDVKEHPRVAFSTQPVPGHADMVLVQPKEAMKPGLYSINAGANAQHEHRFGVATPDEEAFWRDLIKERPKGWQGHSHLGAILYARKDIPGALEQWKLSAELGAEVYETHNNYALALAANGQPEKSLEEYKKAVDLGGNFMVRLNYGEALRMAKQPEEAVKIYTALCKDYPTFATAWLNLGVCYYQQRKLAEAEKCFETALAIKPDYQSARDYLDGTQKLMREDTLMKTMPAPK